MSESRRTSVLVVQVRAGAVESKDGKHHPLEPLLFETNYLVDNIVPIRELGKTGIGPYTLVRCSAEVTRELLDADGKATDNKSKAKRVRYTVIPFGGTHLCLSDPENAGSSFFADLSRLDASKAWFELDLDENGEEPELGKLVHAPKICYQTVEQEEVDANRWFSAVYQTPTYAVLLMGSLPSAVAQVNVADLLGLAIAHDTSGETKLKKLAARKEIVINTRGIDLKLQVSGPEKVEGKAGLPGYTVEVRPASLARVLTLNPKLYHPDQVREVAGIRFKCRLGPRETCSYSFEFIEKEAASSDA